VPISGTISATVKNPRKLRPSQMFVPMLCPNGRRATVYHNEIQINQIGTF